MSSHAVAAKAGRDSWSSMTLRARRLPRAGFAALARAKRFSTPHFTLAVTQNTAQRGCAVVVSKAVAASAVRRHQLKRRARSILLPWCRGSYALAVFAKPGAANLPFAAIHAELMPVLASLPL